MYRIFLFVFLLFVSLGVKSQELKARVNVNYSRVGNAVNKNAFLTLQTSLINFLNNRKWTADTYGQNERIECNFLLNLESTDELNVYKASLMVQSARPVFNSSYSSPIINFKDDNIIFKYQEFQQLEFNENRVAGNDPLTSNLTAIFAYYAYLVVAVDAASFSSHGGEPFFQKAQNIVNNAPDGNGITGWKSFDGIRNRYWLAENFLNSRYSQMQEFYYSYYRLAMDNLYQDEKSARKNMLELIQQLDEFNSQNPNTMVNQFFFQGKSNELIKLFSKSAPQDKSKVKEILSRLDITNASRYKDELK
jgi:hypothetical protein